MISNGIRALYLRKNYEYYINPDDRAFAMMSVMGVHTRMAKADFNRLTEEGLEEGTADCLEEDEQKPGSYVIIDFKLWSSYKIMEAVLAKDIMKELKGETYQLNAYRIGFEKAGFPISKLQLFCIARDGGTYLAKKRGMGNNTVLINLPIIDNEIVTSRYDTMKQAFALAEETKFAPLCNDEETWNGKKCKEYCEVSEICRQIGDNKYLNKGG
jgi:hypothetical protein